MDSHLKWDKPISVSMQEKNGAWSDTSTLKASMQRGLPENGSNVVDRGDEHDREQGTQNGNDTASNTTTQQPEPEQRNG